MGTAEPAVKRLAALIIDRRLIGAAEVVVSKPATCRVVVAAIPTVFVVISTAVLFADQIGVAGSIPDCPAAAAAALKRYTGPANRRHPASLTGTLCLCEAACRRHCR